MSPNWGYKPSNIFWPVTKYPEPLSRLFKVFFYLVAEAFWSCLSRSKKTGATTSEKDGFTETSMVFWFLESEFGPICPRNLFESIFNLGHWNRSGYTIWHCEAHTVKTRGVRVGCGNDFIQKPMIFGAAAVTLPTVPNISDWQASPDSSRFGRSFFFGLVVPKCPCNGKEEGREYGQPTAGPGSHDISQLPSKKNVDPGNLEQAKRAELRAVVEICEVEPRFRAQWRFVTLFRRKCGCKMT